MIKRLCRYILGEEMLVPSVLEVEIEEKDAQIKRLEDVVDKLTHEYMVAREGRGYVFKPENLTEEEQGIIARNIGNEMVRVWKKWFKIKADQNADLLVHFPQEDVEKRVAWSLGVRMYDDLIMQIEKCEKIFNNKEAAQKARENYKK
jgi:hypothetical protein